MTQHNVLIGEVWLCGGQSNMKMPMQGWDIKINADEIAQSGKYKNIRLLQVDELTSNKKKTTVSIKNNGWMTCCLTLTVRVRPYVIASKACWHYDHIVVTV